MHVVMIGSGPFDVAHFQTYCQSLQTTGTTCHFVGVDLGAKRFLEMERVMDLAIGDFDSITESDYLKITQQTKNVIRLNPKKDETDMEAALDDVIQRYPNATYHLFGALGGRLDHTMSNLWLAYQSKYREVITQIRLVNETNHLQFLTPGPFEMDQIMGMKYLSFISLTPVKQLVLENVEYPLQGVDYATPLALISNEFLPGQSQMRGQFTSGLIAAIQARD